jgi:HEAT repeat protein
VLALARDADHEVRSAALQALGSYNTDPQILGMLLQHLDADPSPDVRRACIGAISIAKDHDAVLSAYERHLQNPDDKLRSAIAERLSWLPKEQSARVHGLLRALLSDQNDEVRRTAAWYCRNMKESPAIAELLVHAIQNDPVERVRKDALGSLASVMAMEQVVPYYRSFLQQPPSEGIHWAVMDGVRFKDHPLAKALLSDMTQSPFAKVAKNAREALERA